MRNEIKITVDSIHINTVRNLILLHPSGFIKHHPPRFINNIYYETPDNECFFENSAGLSDRKKYRLRWYGNSFVLNESVFEIKNKKNIYNWKNSYNLNVKIDLHHMKWKEVFNIIKENISSDQDMNFLRHFIPIIINQYYREYYITFDRKIRLTLDYSLKTYPQNSLIYPNIRHKILLDNNFNVEIKSESMNLKEIIGIFESMPLRPGKNSKYINCVKSYL